MQILKLSEGALTFNSNRSLQLNWKTLNLVWYATDRSSYMLDSRKGFVSLWSTPGYYHPKDVWDELSVTLLDYNIVCTPLETSDELTPLPGLEP